MTNSSHKSGQFGGATLVSMIAAVALGGLVFAAGEYLNTSVRNANERGKRQDSEVRDRSALAVAATLISGGALKTEKSGIGSVPKIQFAGATAPASTPSCGAATDRQQQTATTAGTTTTAPDGSWTFTSGGGKPVLSLNMCPPSKASETGGCAVSERLPSKLTFSRVEAETDSTVTMLADLETAGDALATVKTTKTRITFPLGTTGAGTSQSCAILMNRRGSQGNLQYRSHPRNYWLWHVFIPADAAGLATYGRQPPNGYQHKPGVALGSKAVEGDFQPCNRTRDPLNCASKYKPMPSEFKHTDGCTYKLTNANGSCGGDCVCLILTQTSPLVISLDRSPVRYLPESDGVEFDLGEGKVMTTWIANPEAVRFLALDRNGNGAIDDASELFGDTAPGPDGRPANNGFLALAKYDEDANGQIDPKDPVYADLRLWGDADFDGRSSDAELTALAKTGITSVSVRYVEETSQADGQGNVSRQTGRATLSDGSDRPVYDVYFAPGVSPEMWQKIYKAPPRRVVEVLPSE